MNSEELLILRKALITGDNTPLEKIYLNHKQDCINVLLSKNLCDEITSEDVFTEALIVFHKNIVSGQIQKLTSARSYLISTSINLAKKKNDYSSRIHKKVSDVRLLFYANNDTTIEEVDKKKRLISLCKKAMLLLNEKCQRIITAYYIHNLSMKEIAFEFELSSSDVAKTLKSRCYKTLLIEVQKLRN